MSKLKSRVIGAISFRLNKLAGRYAQKVNKLKEKEWDNIFNGKKFIVHDIDDNVKMKLYKDSVLSKWIYDGFEKDEALFVKQVLKKGDVFIDVGCNVGFFSLPASALVGETGKVICFEPSPDTFLKLEDNININHYQNIIAVNKGLSGAKGKMDLNVSQNGFDAWNSFARSEADKLQAKVSVEVSTLDDELSDVDKNKISLIKIDVEGWEKFVLLGGEKFFTQYSPAVLIEFTEDNTYAAGYFVQEIYDIFTNWGYKWFRYANGELIPEPKKLHYPYENLIAAKDIEALRLRIKSF
jgi:FkbM family methyltransferase